MAVAIDEKGVGLALRHPSCHRHRLRRCGGLVEERGVGELHAGEVHHHLLEVEQRLQTALTDLGLIGGVRGVPARVLEHVALDDARHHRAVVPHAHHADEHPVALAHPARGGHQLPFAHRRRQVEGLVVADLLGHRLVDQRLEGIESEERRASPRFCRSPGPMWRRTKSPRISSSSRLRLPASLMFTPLSDEIPHPAQPEPGSWILACTHPCSVQPVDPRLHGKSPLVVSRGFPRIKGMTGTDDSKECAPSMFLPRQRGGTPPWPDFAGMTADNAPVWTPVIPAQAGIHRLESVASKARRLVAVCPVDAGTSAFAAEDASGIPVRACRRTPRTAPRPSASPAPRGRSPAS